MITLEEAREKYYRATSSELISFQLTEKDEETIKLHTDFPKNLFGLIVILNYSGSGELYIAMTLPNSDYSGWLSFTDAPTQLPISYIIENYLYS